MIAIDGDEVSTTIKLDDTDETNATGTATTDDHVDGTTTVASFENEIDVKTEAEMTVTSADGTVLMAVDGTETTIDDETDAGTLDN
jgi:hypothetical protein